MGERAITARSDIYALGAMTYEMLVGEPPFTGPTAQAIIAKVMTAEPVAPTSQRKTIPPHVEAAVLTALQKLPADRYGSAAQFAEALATPGAAGSPVAGRAPVGAARRSRWIRSASLAVAGAAIAVVAFVLGRGGASGANFEHVAFSQRTFTDQAVFAARFTHDGETIVYSAATEGNTPRLYILRPDYPSPSPLGDPGTQLLAVSSRDELAVLVHPVYLGFRLFAGTLARMPLSGGAPRELLAGVREADWSPDGSQLAIIHDVDGTDRLEYPIGTVRFQSTGYLSDLRISPAGDRIAFMEHPLRYDDRGVVGVVDLHGHHRTLTREYWGLQGLAWSADGRRILFGGASDAGFYQVHSASLDGHERLVLPSAGNLYILDLAPSGRWLVTREDRTVRLFVRPPGASADQDYSWSYFSTYPTLSGDGSLLAFTDASREAGATYATMVRKTDGSAAVRLGPGAAYTLSPDKRWVLSTVLTTPPQLMLYPVGPGDSRRLDHGELESYNDGLFFPDGKSLLVCGSEPGHSARCYVRPLAGGALRAVTPEGTLPGATISPDGRTVLAQTTAGFSLYPLDGGSPRPVPALGAEDRVVRWNPDGRSVWVTRADEVPLKLELLDLATGRRRPLMMLQPANRAGIVELSAVSLADDPRVYAYSAVKQVARIFVVTGMK